MDDSGLYRLHTEEVRFQVRLGWDRAKASLGFNAALLVATAGLGHRLPRSLAVALFVFTAAACVLGAVAVHVGHDYYRHARDRRAQLETRLGLELGFATTPTMRGEARQGWRKAVKLTTVLVVLHGLWAVVALVGALAAWSR